MYIYQRKGWPHFTWDEEQFSSRLGEVRHRQGKILGRMQALGFRLQEETMLDTLTLDVIKTSEIEGQQLNPDQVRSSIARRLGIEVAGTVTAERHVEGVVAMMLDATQNYHYPLSQERLFGWHAALFPTGYSGLYKIKTGAWRDGPMEVTSGAMGRERVHFEAPHSDKVQDEMARFVQWMNDDQRLDAVIKAAVAHFWFVTIHPFDDGNGRIARAIADLLLACADQSTQRFYSMSAQILKERNEYYNILERTQKGDLNITSWLQWFLDCLYRSMEHTDQTIDKIIVRAQFWKEHRDEQFNARQLKVLQLLLDDFYGKLSVSKWATITKTSTDTALRDIQDLIKKEILQPEGSGRGTTYRLIREDENR